MNALQLLQILLLTGACLATNPEFNKQEVITRASSLVAQRWSNNLGAAVANYALTGQREGKSVEDYLTWGIQVEGEPKAGDLIVGHGETASVGVMISDLEFVTSSMIARIVVRAEKHHIKKTFSTGYSIRRYHSIPKTRDQL